MECSSCRESGWFKTCRLPDSTEVVLCDPCWEGRGYPVIVPGSVTVTARCDGCLEFMNPRELAVRRALVKEVYRGTCRGCVRA